MSQPKTCPFCKRAIRGRDKYCPFCGEYVLESTAPQNVYSPSRPPQQPPYQPPQQTPPYYAPPPRTGPTPPAGPPPGTAPAPSGAPAPPPEQQDVELSDDIIDQIVLRVELAQLDKSMDDVRGKLEDLAEQISKIEVTTEIEAKIKKFKNHIKEIKAKREKLNAEKSDLPFEGELTEKKEIKERLKNLNEAYRSKKVTDAAFKKLRGEYEAKLKEIDQKSQAFKAKINTWIKKFKVDEAKVSEALELLEARHAAGELSESAYEQEKTTTTAQLKRYNAVIQYLTGQI